ncbi:unnamed protein product, partial [Cuscuta europaea]
MCKIVDLLTNKEIGRGHERGGLYVVSSSGSTPTILSISSETWHYRLSHPSPTVFKHLSPILGCSPFNDLCHFCHISKQTCLPFPTHYTSTTACFELIHVDIWGKYSTPTRTNHCYFL